MQIGYRTADGSLHELRVSWMVFSPGPSGTSTDSSIAEVVAKGVDAEMEMAGLAKKLLFAPSIIAAETAIAAGKSPRRTQLGNADIVSNMPGVLTARAVDTPSGSFGHIRIHTFSVGSADTFVQEFVRLCNLLPEEGLIIDVRGNGGGLITAGEQLLQVLTPREIEPERTQFINTMLNLEIVRLHAPSPFQGFSLEAWLDSMEESILTGASFSRGFPITDPDAANAIGQQYQGPIVLITDAKCYSTTDIFAAGFQDHEIGKVLGVDGNTGAGGANVWTHGLLSQLAGVGGADNPYAPLPGGADMRVAIRRTLRVGEQTGTPLEDLGVKPDFHHQLTRNDLLNGNIDLISRAAEILAGSPRRLLKATVNAATSGELSLMLETLGIDRVDVNLDNRPLGSIDVHDGDSEIVIPDVVNVESIGLQGFDNEIHVITRTLDL